MDRRLFVWLLFRYQLPVWCLFCSLGLFLLHKKKIQEVTDDIDKIFLDENFLVRFKNELRKQQENINEQLCTD